MECKQVTCFGEILWDNLPSGPKIGGAPLNVGYHLRKKNIEVNLISQVGDDQLGRRLVDELIGMDITTDYCGVTADYPTSEVNVHIDTNQNISYHIEEQVAWDYIEYDAKLNHVIKNSSAVVYGTLSSRNAVSATTLKMYLQYGVWNVLDLNLRIPYYDLATLNSLIEHANLLKLNLEELNVLNRLFFNSSNYSNDSIISNLFNEFTSLNEILITKGAAGAYYYTREISLEFDSIDVQVADTVGCGDAFLAGFVFSRLSNYSIEDCMREAIVLSAFVASKVSGCPAYENNEFEAFKSATC